MTLPRFVCRHLANPKAERRRAYGDAERAVLGLRAFEQARAEIGAWPGYAPTPLRSMPKAAAALGIAALSHKDESARFHLKSFKALGGAYAVLRVLSAELEGRLGRRPTAAELATGRHAASTNGVTVAAATDGNHGRSVAWGAEMFHCACVIYLHERVSRAREEEIARFGATIVRVPGSYDDSVRRCAADAGAQGWHLVADTSDDRHASIPALVMQGYTIMAQEILDQLAPGSLPSHVLVPAGVGGLAAALAAHWWELLAEKRPRLVAVEPVGADCLYRAVAAGRPVAIDGDTDTFMACLAAGEVSAPAWVVLEHGLDDVVAIEDEAAAATMRLLARGLEGDAPVVAGESGAAAMAALIAIARDAGLRRALAIDEGSRIVTIGSEGATDAVTFERVTGLGEAEVGAGGGSPEASTAVPTNPGRPWW